MISLLDSEKIVRIVADTRTEDGTRQVYGGLYPAAVLYLSPSYAQSNAKTVQSLTNAFVRGLKWIAGHSAEDIARLMPVEHALGNMAMFIRSIQSSKPMYSPDGLFSAEGAATALKVLREFDAGVRDAPINLSETYISVFLDKATGR